MILRTFWNFSCILEWIPGSKWGLMRFALKEKLSEILYKFNRNRTIIQAVPIAVDAIESK